MKIINIEKMRALALNNLPFRYGKISNILNSESYVAICEQYPVDGFIHCQTLDQEKTYSMRMKQLYDSRRQVNKVNDLSELWVSFVGELLSAEYLAVMSSLSQKNLQKCEVEINCWQYPSGGWLSPHTDKPDKVVSQLFYMNEDWDRSWGGAFNVLNSSRDNDIHEQIFPDNNLSVVLVRSDKSWHSVEPLKCPENVVRKLVQIIFWDK